MRDAPKHTPTPATTPTRPRGGHLSGHPYRAFLHRMAKPARYTGGEFQSRVKPWDSVAMHYALCFPDVYDIGMSHLGTKILYGLVNDIDWALGERCFAPWPDLGDQLRAEGLPLVSLENWRPLADFDVVGFSLQFELTTTNILEMLRLGGIPIRNADRTEAAPLVIAGGPCATHPEPLAPFIDAFVIGDGEETLPRLLACVRDGRSEGVSRRELLIRLAALGGIYCPDLYTTGIIDDGGFEVVTGRQDPDELRVPERVIRHIVKDIDAYPFPDDAPVAAAAAIFDRMSIEIARGCTEGCRFCQAGMIYRPVRERSPTAVVETVARAVDKAGYDEVSLTTLSTADYSAVSPLIKQTNAALAPRNTSMSVASLRAYGLADELLAEIETIRANSLTFAPEAGSQRMRDVVNKNISAEDLRTTAHRVFSRNWRKVKTYFMIGLPTEEDEDVVAIVETALEMRELGRQHKRDAQVTVSVSSHVPKPHTPFQWARMDSPEEIEAKQQILGRLCYANRLDLRRHDVRGSFLEGILGRGDRRVADIIEAAWRAGARFDGWTEHLAWPTWLDVLASSDVDTERYLGRIREDVRLPWDHIDVGLEDGFLLREWRRALKGRLSPPCGKPVGMQVHHTNVADALADKRKLVCYNCGVACDLVGMREERTAFLDQLGALRPTATAGSDSEADAEAAPAPEPEPKTSGVVARPSLIPPRRRGPRGGKSKALPRIPYAGPVFRYRLRFTKQGAEALTSHLDLVRGLPRFLRRAGVKLRYSDGFHPKPVVAFAPALPLGASSLGELMDIDLVEHLDATALLARLQAASTPGLRFLGVDEISRQDSLADAIGEAWYAIELNPGEGATPLDRVRVEQALWHFMAAGSWLGRVVRKGKAKRVDMRANVRAMWLDDEGRVRLVQEMSDRASARPHEIVAAALADVDEVAPVEPRDIERLALLPTEMAQSASVSDL